MSGFSAHWLALREPVDLAARSAAVEEAFLQALPHRRLRILDLASGAGSTVAALAKRSEREIDWILTDHDPALLKVAGGRWSCSTACSIETRQVDLQAELETLPFSEVDAVTTSAFLDLVSREFLERLADCLAAAQKPFLASLTYDGRSTYAPEHPFDVEILAAMNAHQRREKGIGSALGPDAALVLSEIFSANGFRIASGNSDWQAGAEDRDFCIELMSGWASVAVEMGLDRNKVRAWQEAREQQLAQGTLRLTVGHVDIAALPK